mmetsp:Transcript_19971/g.51837  ORF Transcript_19971/g.51837 Transcript_19971/m.51837 type:complete len:202 (+) Transcript_19971:791-1396(+)
MQFFLKASRVKLAPLTCDVGVPGSPSGGVYSRKPAPFPKGRFAVPSAQTHVGPPTVNICTTPELLAWWYEKALDEPTAAMIGSFGLARNAAADRWKDSVGANGRDMDTLRRPPEICDLVTVSVDGSTVPAAWFPRACSVTLPSPSTTIVYGFPAIEVVLNPMPNHTFAGPVMITLRVSPATSTHVPRFATPVSAGSAAPNM